MKLKGEKLLRWILLEGIRSEEDAPKRLLKIHNAENDAELFKWSFLGFIETVYSHPSEIKEGLFTAVFHWLEGLPFGSVVPFSYEEIENLGLDSNTYFEDLARVYLQNTTEKQEFCRNLARSQELKLELLEVTKAALSRS